MITLIYILHIYIGITGFETAANYVEDMSDPSVFVTTVNVLWYVITNVIMQ